MNLLRPLYLLIIFLAATSSLAMPWKIVSPNDNLDLTEFRKKISFTDQIRSNSQLNRLIQTIAETGNFSRVEAKLDGNSIVISRRKCPSHQQCLHSSEYPRSGILT